MHRDCLSSSADAIVGKSGHVILDEFALHKDQRQLYTVAKPVIQWGGTLTIISTHRGMGTLFHELVETVRRRGNPMGWSLHSIPIQKAVGQGIVEKIRAVTGEPAGKTKEEVTGQREAWLARQRAECIDEEQWLQEYCCVPLDESSAFITYELMAGCEDDSARRDFAYLAALDPRASAVYIGFDVARTADLSVIDVEEKAGDVFWERMRIELRGKTFAEQEFELTRLLNLPVVRRCCIDATGIGMQLAENMVARHGHRVEAVRTFTGPVKEELAFPLRAAHEERRLRYARDEKLRGDLRGIKMETTESGNIRFCGRRRTAIVTGFGRRRWRYMRGKAAWRRDRSFCLKTLGRAGWRGSARTGALLGDLMIGEPDNTFLVVYRTGQQLHFQISYLVQNGNGFASGTLGVAGLSPGRVHM